MRILFVLPRTPWPPYAGQARLAFNRARYLHQAGHDVYLFSYGLYVKLKPVVEGTNSSSFYTDPKVYSFNIFHLLATALSFAKDRFVNSIPLVALLYTPAIIRSLFRRHLASGNFDIIHFYSINSFPLWEIASNQRIPFVVDLIDSMALNLRARSQAIPLLFRSLFSSELNSIRKFESNLPAYPCCFAYIAVGDKDLSFLGIPPNRSKIFTPKLLCHSIGVDIPKVQPLKKLEPQPFDILLFGSLYYYPNVEAAIWFAEEVCPLLLNSVNLNFVIAGARPSKALYDLASNYSFVRLLPNPPNMNTLVASSAITVAPMRSGSGQQFKVVESLALSTPVVATSMAANPLGLFHNHHLLVADTPGDFAASVKMLLDDPTLYQRLSCSGFEYVQHNFSWSNKAQALSHLYSQASSQFKI